jgi:alginate O-acetyltransferase complex protein AlgJ
MIRTYRRYWAIPAFLVMFVPLLWGVLAPQGTAENEPQRRAPVPSWPHTWNDWSQFPRTADAWLGEHFGLRQAAIRIHALLTNSLLGSGNNNAMLGHNGSMFLRWDQMLEQSAGLLIREERLSQTVDVLVSVRDALDAIGVRFLVAVPPNSSSIATGDLPSWIRNDGRPTELDLLLQAIRARGIATVDLRPILRRATAEGSVYRKHDTHWTALGAILAFNAVVETTGHPEWKLEPGAVLGPIVSTQGGDLARMLGLQNDVAEPYRYFALPQVNGTSTPDPPYPPIFHATSGRKGPAILIIGDSFTQAFFIQLVLERTSEITWMHRRTCDVDWAQIVGAHPSEVWWMPTERALLCADGARPRNLPLINRQ